MTPRENRPAAGPSKAEAIRKRRAARRAQAAKLRAKGKKLREIGDAMGITAQGAAVLLAPRPTVPAVRRECRRCGASFGAVPRQARTCTDCRRSTRAPRKRGRLPLSVEPTYDLWTVIERGPDGGHERRWWCRCECGKTRLILGRLLRKGQSRGCLKCVREAARRG